MKIEIPEPLYHSTYELWEKNAALLFPDGRVREYASPVFYNGSEPLSGCDVAEHARNLSTDRVFTCGVVVMRHEEPLSSHALRLSGFSLRDGTAGEMLGMLHAFNLPNLDEQCKAVLKDWRERAPLPTRVAIYTSSRGTSPYAEVVRDHLPGASIVDRKVNCPGLHIVAGYDVPDRFGVAYDNCSYVPVSRIPEQADPAELLYALKRQAYGHDEYDGDSYYD